MYSSQVPDSFGGKTVPCPKCGQPLTIGGSAASAATPSDPKQVTTTDIVATKKRPTTMMAFPLFGDQKPDEGPQIGTHSTRRLNPCPGCKAGMSERERYCSKCGWDTKENQRKCRQCQLPYILQDGMGSTGVQLGVSAAIAGIVGYVYDWVAGGSVGLFMAGVGSLVNSLTAGFKCTGCNKGIESSLMSPDEKKASSAKRLTALIVALVLILAAAAGGAYWYTHLKD